MASIYKKKGDLTDPSNYRGITLLSPLGKVFTKMINDRFDNFENDDETIKKKQVGLRKKLDTDQVFSSRTLIESYLISKRNFSLRGSITRKRLIRYRDKPFGTYYL